MLFRATLLAAAAGLATLSPPTTSYRIEQRVDSRIDLSAFGQGEQQQSQAFVWFTTMSYQDSAGGLVVHAVLDSAQADFGMASVPPGVLDSARGTTFHGYLDGTGRMVSITGSKKDLVSGQFEGFLKTFHPRIRAGSKAGDAWTDTLDINTETAQATTRTQTITNFQFTGMEERQGVSARKIEASFSSVMTGKMQTPGGPADMDGKATGTGTYFVGPDGHYLGGRLTSNGDATISGAFAPAAIPIRNTTTVTVTVLK
ncbi:MAG TPA: hypothetical protein VLL51_03320 [Gemmatimonadales bacterium]|nr:hypothetical protein [Gemmatimonadales bacterium]